MNTRVTDATVGEALAELAAQHELGVAELNGVYFVGPERTARALPAISRQTRNTLRTVPAARRKLWLRVAPSSWPRLSEPRQLLSGLLREAKVELADDELLPHDLWPARELPPLALIDRVVLLLAGFDLACEISPDGSTCRLVPIEYPLSIDDDKAPQLIPAKPSRKPADSEQREFSLQLVNQPVGHVLEQVAKQLQLELIWDEASLTAKGLSRETLVSCELNRVDLDGLLRGILEPADMTFTRDGRRLEIRALP